jgi:hypothetical protein
MPTENLELHDAQKPRDLFPPVPADVLAEQSSERRLFNPTYPNYHE